MFWGVSVVGITLIARFINPKYTGIIYALPVILIVALVFIYLSQGLGIAKSTLKSTFIYEFTLVYFILAFYLLLSQMGFWWSLILAFVSWAVISALIQVLFRL